MSLIFLIFLTAFILLIKQKKKLALAVFSLGLVCTVAMFFYHTTSSLQLNF
ncbi:hypothetical protein BN863_22450 [Formosa agariphila KMM 3901]|uniref:Uncharacterized protein n=1 Tax=Formosa agariphila (strain DSM 15362 / KCTC 12365 / LMG 23005 / KMM 3901 / M-2Alg 35-1) TaxID=1347342 RepID=T2KM43_FORAG|nr:DUF5993 family protein [Formosa agariphila]CDF79957.1 hypothetical protein BN863_22450 [Formosa agariphila KMM 3901]